VPGSHPTHSPPPEPANTAPSGDPTRQLTGPTSTGHAGPGTGAPAGDRAQHRAGLPSAATVTSTAPPRANAAWVTSPACPWTDPSGRPLARSHTATVPSV